MPVVLFINGFKFKFYSNENNEPPHVHITKGNAKYWLFPEIEETYSYGFTVRERRDVRELVLENKDLLIRKWNEYFGL